MGGFFTILAAVVIFIIGKFIYDSYLTNNTEKNWNRYVNENQSQPSKNRDLPIKKTQPRPLIAHKYKSLSLIAKSYNCESSKVKDFFLAEIKKELETNTPEEIIENLKLKKIIEAQQYNLHQDVTPSGIKEKWFLEIIHQKDSEIMEDNNTTNKSEIISMLKLEIERELLEVAKKEIDENPNRDNMMQSMFVIHEIESFGEKIEIKIIEEKEHYKLSEEEISSLVNESIGNVMRGLFKDII